MQYEIRIILSILLTYRVAHDIATQTGMFGIFQSFRDFISKKFGAGSWVAEGVHCPLCISFWVSLFCTLTFFYSSLMAIIEIMLVWGGIAGGCLVLHYFIVSVLKKTEV